MNFPREKGVGKIPSVSVSLALEQSGPNRRLRVKVRALFPSQDQLSFVLVHQNSVTRSAPINSDSQGRCGTRFLTTYDRRFVIKTVSSEDVAEMHILKKYHQFTVECHSNTFLPVPEHVLPDHRWYGNLHGGHQPSACCALQV